MLCLMIQKAIKYILESNRYKHFLFAIPLGFMTIWGGLIAGCSLEFKDKQWGGKWDWVDLGFTIAGGIVGWVLNKITLNVWLY